MVGLSSLNLSVAAVNTERAWYRVPSEVVTREVSSYALISLIFDGVFLFTIFELCSLAFEIKNKAHSSRVRTKRVWLVVECGSIQYSKTHTILGLEFILKGRYVCRDAICKPIFFVEKSVCENSLRLCKINLNFLV